MELKNKYSKQIIYSNQKFEDQIWYNQQIMTFLNFLQLPESVFRPNFLENTFLKIKPNFSLTEKYFPLTNFPEDKQTQESLESNFPESEFRETNTALILLLFALRMFNTLAFWIAPSAYWLPTPYGFSSQSQHLIFFLDLIFLLRFIIF